jgi:hypothetical protein
MKIHLKKFVFGQVTLILALACFGLSPTARAVCQEGCLANDNTVLGDDALLNNGIGVQNTAIGFNALFSNTVASFNTATGFWALYSNSDGIANTATGNRALYSNTGGHYNTGHGYGALQSNTVGTSNTAAGIWSLFSNTTGNNNTATGESALFFNTTASGNTASGSQALYNNLSGSDNTAMGFRALYSNRTGSNNTVIGIDALTHNSSGDDNIAIGRSAGRALRGRESNNICIGDIGLTGESNAIRIGRQGIHTATYVAGISGTTVPEGVAVIVDSNGHLGTAVSSARFKYAIKPMDKISEAVLALKPVTFRYDNKIDPGGIPQFGLVAEEVEKVNPDLVGRDDQGKPYTVRYEAVNAMLLNEFLKARRQIDAQQKQIDALTEGLEKVSAQLEASKPAPRTVLNNQ